MKVRFLTAAALLVATAPMLMGPGDINGDGRSDIGTAGGTNQTAPAASQTLGTPPRVVRADGKLVCDKKTYLLSTGTGGGSCVSGVGSGDCQDGGNTASASCGGGCGATSGKGSCTEQ